MLRSSPIVLLAILATCLSLFCRRATAFSASPQRVVPVRSSSLQLQASIETYLDDNNYDKIILGSSKAVLVDACAQWCGPCRLIQPFLENSADKYADDLEIVKLDVEAKHTGGVKVELLLMGCLPEALPSLIMFRDGKHVATHTGALTQAELDRYIESNLRTSETNGEEKGEKLVGVQRGFISFASGRDDYAL